MWLFFTLLSAFFWGVGQVFVKKGLGNTTSLFNNLLCAIVILFVTIPYALASGGQLSDLPKLLPISLVITTLLLCYYYVLAKADISLVGTVFGTYPIFTILFSFLFLHESPSIFQKIAAGLVIAGTLLLIVGEDLDLAKKFRFGTWALWGIMGSFAAGTADFLAKIALNMVEERASSYILSYGIAFIFIACISALFDKNGRKFPKVGQKKFLPTLIGVTMIEMGMVVFLIALSMGFASIVTAISSCYVAITAVLAWIFLQEKVNKLQMFGVLITCVGIILLGLS